jgi:hypothetical protein
MKVRRKTKPLNAIQFTGDNRDEFDKYLKNNAEIVLIYKKEKVDQIQIRFIWGYIRTLGKGDYLIRNSNGIYERVNRDVFRRNYEVVG